MTPDQMVADVVASAALDGRRIDPEWLPVLHRIATGELDADEAVRGEVERARRMTGVSSVQHVPWFQRDPGGGTIFVKPSRDGKVWPPLTCDDTQRPAETGPEDVHL